MKVVCSSEQSLHRVEAERWRNRMKLMNPVGEVVVVLPCSMKKPYSNSKSHQRFMKATRSYQELILTSPFGICPRELESTYPIQSYDVSTTGQWSYEEKKIAGELLKEYVGDKKVIANLSGGYLETCEEYLDDVIYTCEDERPTSADSIYNLRMELKNYKRINKKEKRLNKLRSISLYQFGKDGDILIPDDVKVKGRYHKKIFYNNEQLALLNMDRGLYSLNLNGGSLLFEKDINCVEIDFNLETNTIFAPGIVKADKNILPNDEVVVVKDNECIAVGRAIFSGEEMEKSNRGTAVRIRHRKK